MDLTGVKDVKRVVGQTTEYPVEQRGFEKPEENERVLKGQWQLLPGRGPGPLIWRKEYRPKGFEC